jgi:hypothetical protein
LLAGALGERVLIWSAGRFAKNGVCNDIWVPSKN